MKKRIIFVVLWLVFSIVWELIVLSALNLIGIRSEFLAGEFCGGGILVLSIVAHWMVEEPKPLSNK